MNELKDILNYEGLYAITTEGQVWGYKRKHFLKPCKDKGGYSFVNLSKDGKYKTFYIHRLVAEAYLPNPEGLPQVGHKDGSRDNNDISNLYWTDAKENSNESIRVKRLSEAQGKPVFCIELNKEFKSGKEAAEQLNLNRGNLSSCLKGKQQTCGGFHWKYIN